MGPLVGHTMDNIIIMHRICHSTYLCCKKIAAAIGNYTKSERTPMSVGLQTEAG